MSANRAYSIFQNQMATVDADRNPVAMKGNNSVAWQNWLDHFSYLYLLQLIVNGDVIGILPPFESSVNGREVENAPMPHLTAFRSRVQNLANAVS